MVDGAAPHFSLEIPSGPHAPATSRLFIGSVLTSLNVAPDVIEDARLATSEAVSLIVRHGTASRASVSVDGDGTAVTIRPVRTGDGPHAELEVIEALFPDHTLRPPSLTLPLR